MSASGILAGIAEERSADAKIARRKRPESSLARECSAPRPLFRGSAPFVLIAECKRASPSRGLMLERYDPAALAAAYARGGASALSVLTEPRHFLGADSHLGLARIASGLPVLRKDFILEPYQVCEAWAIGADAVLLIAALLDRTRIAELAACARSLGLETLLEIHAEQELELVDETAVDAVGVNARDLANFVVDPLRSRQLAAELPRSLRRVAESGLRNADEAVALQHAGYDAFLVGEAFVRAPAPEVAVRAFAAALAGAGGPRGAATPAAGAASGVGSGVASEPGSVPKGGAPCVQS